MSTRRELNRIAAAVEGLGDAPSPRNTGIPDRSEKLPLMARLTLWWGTWLKDPDAAIWDRRSFPIVAFVGANGGGKTLAAVATTLPTRKGIRWKCDNPDHYHTQRGETEGWRRILSTVPILDGKGGLHPLYDKFDDLEQLVYAEHCDVVADEVVSLASSRESARMDARLVAKLVQLRKADILFIWTAPNWARADKVLREVTQLVVQCKGFYPLPREAGEEVTASTLWRPKRVFSFYGYDASEFEEWSMSKRDQMSAVTSQWMKGPGCEAFNAYDTLGAVTIVRGMTPENTCTVCEGTITRHRCNCKTRPSLTPPEALDVSLLPAQKRPVTVEPPAPVGVPPLVFAHSGAE